MYSSQTLECWLEPQVNVRVTQVLEWNARDVFPGSGPLLATGGQMAGSSGQTRGRGDPANTPNRQLGEKAQAVPCA